MVIKLLIINDKSFEGKVCDKLWIRQFMGLIEDKLIEVVVTNSSSGVDY